MLALIAELILSMSDDQAFRFCSSIMPHGLAAAPEIFLLH